MKYFNKGADQNDLVYPITKKQISSLEECNLVSVRVGDHWGIPMPAALCNDASMEIAKNEVLEVREMVEKDVFPREFMEKYYPRDWGEFPKEIPQLLSDEGLSFDEPKGLANVVHMDTPLDLGEAMIRWLISQGAAPKDADSVTYDFLNIVPRSLAKMSAQVNAKMEKCFQVKYYYGIPRPEELVGTNITAYPEGCPNHPSFPAGHGAAAFASSDYFLMEWKLNEVSKKALFDSAYIWAMARTLAGVHYAVDNLPYASRKI